MKLIVVALLCFSLFPPAVPGQQTSASPRPLVIQDVTVIDATGAPPRPDSTVVISDGRITYVGPSDRASIPSTATVLDGSRKYVIPGLWDMHIHLTIIPDHSVTANVLAPMLLAYGITSVRDMGGDWRRIQALRAAISSGEILGPRIISPGPFVDGPEPLSPFFISVNNPAEARRAVRKLKADGVDFIKVQSELSLESWRAVLDEAKKLHIPVVGHIPVRVSAFDVARSSQRSIEHISPILPGDAGILLASSSNEARLRTEILDIEHAASLPGADRTALGERQHRLEMEMISTFDPNKCGSLLALLKRNHIYSVPTQVFGRNAAPLASKDYPDDASLQLVPKSMRDKWRKDREAVVNGSSADDFARRGKIAKMSRALVGYMHRAGVKLMAGTDAIDTYVVPGFSLHQELELIVTAGLSPMEALQTATRNPADFLGHLDSMGTIEPGKIADLVILDANPIENISNTQRIDAVIQNGRLLNRHALAAMLDSIRKFAQKN